MLGCAVNGEIELALDKLRRERDEARHLWAWAVEDGHHFVDDKSPEDFVVELLRRRFDLDEDEARRVARMDVP
jgi:ATP-dependent Clp protease adapter protein ClpS